MAFSERPRTRSIPAADVADTVRPVRILVADDDCLTREQLTAMLEKAGYLVDTVDDGQGALDRVMQGGIDLVLLDVVMPRLTGLEACRLLKGVMRTGFLPVVLMAVKTDTASRLEGIRVGADDYLCKPLEETELLAHVTSMLRLKRIHDHTPVPKAKVDRVNTRDDLTGLLHFRYLATKISDELKRAEREHDPLACLLVDIEQLRAINDLGGRTAGDSAIVLVAESIKRCVREVDEVGRYGGDEFLVVLPGMHFARSVATAERIWRDVNRHRLDPEMGERRSEPSRRSWRAPSEHGPLSDPRWFEGTRPLHVSIGVALFPSRDVHTREALLRGAEQALAQAKHEGGNRICVFQQPSYLYIPDGAPTSSRPDENGRKGA